VSRKSRRASAAAAKVTAPPATPAASDRASIALWATLAAMVALRAAFGFGTGTWMWSLTLHRFLVPIAGWGLWLIAALALVPVLSRRLLGLVTRRGNAIDDSPAPATAGWALASAALALLLPDRVRFVGDFLLRQGTVEIAERPALLFPQALPLDVFLHYTIPLRFTTTQVLDANGAARMFGAFEAAALGAIAAGFARTLNLRGGAAFATAAIVLFGGYLGMYTGYSKAFAEMTLLVALAGASAVGVVRSGRGLLPLGLSVAVATLLHRSALGMYPMLALVWGVWLARNAHRGAWRRPGAIAAFAAPLVALAIMGPRITETVMKTDTSVHFAPAEVQSGGGVLGAALSGTRPIDLLSLILMLSPLALAILPVGALLGRRAGRGAATLELGALAALAAPFVAIMVFIHPAQGLFRDWDDFAATGVAVSLIVAWLAAETLRDSRRFAWLAVAVTLGVAVPSLQWLLVHSDSVRGLKRVRAFVTEPPVRPPAQRGTTWDFLGIRSYRLERYAEAEEALSHAAETSPSPRILHEWAYAAAMAGHDRAAQQAYQKMLAKDPGNNLGWFGLAAASMRLRDVPEAKRAASELQRREPANADAKRILDDIGRYEALVADSIAKARAR
jgi:hypothetical protein